MRIWWSPVPPGPAALPAICSKGAADQQPIALGSRNQYDAGIQQGIGGWLLLDVSYFRKYTRNAFDFDTLFSTPVTFPIGWKQSKLDGVSARISTVEMHGLRVYATMGHANARFFGPENGGIIFNSNLNVGAYRQDHDQVYQQNVNLHYLKSPERLVGGFHLALRQRPGGGRGQQSARRTGLDRRPAVHDRFLLRWRTGFAFASHHGLQSARLRSRPNSHSSARDRE